MVYAEYRKLYAPNDRVWQVLGPVPAALRRQVTGIAAAEAPPSTELHTIEQFPAGAHVLPQSEGLALIRGGPRDMSGYPALQQKYGAGNVLSLSKPVITDDGLDAFVHYSHGCGSACGTLGYVWLHRMSRGQPWTARVAVTAGS